MVMNCSYPANLCKRPALVGGLCRMHYLRKRRTGELGKPEGNYKKTSARATAEAVKRFSEVVEKLGARSWLYNCVAGTATIEGRPCRTVKVGIAEITGWQRRGWVSPGEYTETGSRRLALLKKGERAIASA